MRIVVVHDGFFEGVVSFHRGDGWLQPLRLKADEIPLHLEAFVAQASCPSGCRLRFATTSRSVALDVEPDTAEGVRRFDLTTDEALLATADLPPGAGRVRFDGLPDGWKTLELWLPPQRAVRIRDLGVEDGADLEPSPDRRPRWVTYGSSITHCNGAHSPSRTWPAVAARRRGMNLTSLGYSGQCHLDPLVAMMIRDRAADFVSLKVGINMVGGSVSPRTFRPLLVGMVRIIREKHPTTPLAVVSPILSPPREGTPGATGMTLRMMREELETAVARLRACGDANVHYISGLDLLGEDLVATCLPDLLHPNGDGYEIMGRNFAEKVMDRLGVAPRP